MTLSTSSSGHRSKSMLPLYPPRRRRFDLCLILSLGGLLMIGLGSIKMGSMSFLGLSGLVGGGRCRRMIVRMSSLF